MRIYLAGPINGCTDEEAHGWRREARRLLPGCVFLDPMDRDYRGVEAQNVAAIVNGDLADIDTCDVLYHAEVVPTLEEACALIADEVDDE